MGVARTQEEIRENMTRSLTGREAGLFGLWDFEDGGARDVTTNQHHGVLKGKARVISGTRPRNTPIPPNHIIRGRVFDSKGIGSNLSTQAPKSQSIMTAF